MPPVAPENEFVPSYSMDLTHSYYNSLRDAQGIISNTIILVYQEFFSSVGWSNLRAESMSATLRVFSHSLSLLASHMTVLLLLILQWLLLFRPLSGSINSTLELCE